MVEANMSSPEQLAKSEERHPLQRCEHYLPGLESKPWWDGSELSFVQTLESNAEQIRAEYIDILLSGSLRLHPQSKGGPRRRASNGDWNIFELWSAGRLNQCNAVEAPFTTPLLSSIPELITNPRGLVYFSVLNPHVHIRAHCGPTNARIRLHLGLQVPSGAFMRVGEERRTWKRGKCLVFDDSWEHEVWNKSDQLRAVLLMDTWHPQLGKEQREQEIEQRTTNDKRLGEREGWRRPLNLEPAPEGPTGDAETSSGDVLRAMFEDDAKPIRNKALMVRHCGIKFIELAAEYTLAALESPANAGGDDVLDAVTDQTSVWLSLARFFSAGSGNEFGFIDAKDVIHLCGIYWRSKKRNLLAMYEFDEQWTARERSALLDNLIGLRSPLGMMSFLADSQQAYNQLPVGAVIPLVVAALRELGCGRSH
jgi:aspartyl/asparaginyl beta-hydroxylase (cupin superfamily)